MRNPRAVSDAQLQKDVKAYYDNSGDRSAAARARGLKRQTYNSRLEAAEARFKIKLGKVADGRVEAFRGQTRKLPRRGSIKRYLLTSIQNNTYLHPAWRNVLALREWLDGLDGSTDTCELMVGTYSYQISAYGKKAVKRGTFSRTKATEELWYAPEAEPYIVDDQVLLAPGLVWAGKFNALPTAKYPLTGLESYNGRLSNIVPHAKMCMESVASMADEATKFNYSTGTMTQRNYIQKTAGIVAEQDHQYGLALVEVDAEGNWWVRHVEVSADGDLMDVGPEGYNGVHVHEGEVSGEYVTANINWGDAHAAEMERWVRELAWGEGGMIDVLMPQNQCMNDVFSMRTRGHWELRDFHRTYEKHVDGEETVEEEVQVTADLMVEAHRDFCDTYVIPSNHDRHLSRWLNEADFRLDPVNAKYFCRLQYQVLDAMDRGDHDFNPLEWALRQAGCPKAAVFLGLDEGLTIAGVENGLHGDLGANGSRGSTKGLTKLGRPINKGHDHTAARCGKVCSAGACSLDFPFMKGPNSHSISHIVTYLNEARTIVTMWAGQYRASRTPRKSRID